MFTLLHPDPEKSPLCCDICFCGEVDYTRYSEIWGTEGQLVDMYWCDQEKLTVCENCKSLIIARQPVHNWREHGF